MSLQGDVRTGDHAPDRAAYTARLVASCVGGTPEALRRIAALAARVLRTRGARIVLLADGEHVVASTGETRTAAQLDVPLLAGNGLEVGRLSVHDDAARVWTDDDRAVLADLSGPVLAELELAALLTDYSDDRVVWQLAVDAAGVGAFDWHLPTDELRWDDRLLDLFGLDRTSFGGNIGAFNEVVHPDDRGRVSAALEHAIATCGAYEADYRVIHPGGEVRWIAARGHALAGTDGGAVKLVGAAYDTTVVRDEDARVARVMESMPTAFFQLDRDWRFVFVNGEAARILGMSREMLLGGVLWDLFPLAVGSEFETHYRHALDHDEPVSFEAFYPPPLDAWFEVRAWPSPEGLAVYFLDISPRRQAQEQLDFAARRSEILADLTGALTGTLDIEEAVRTLAPLMVPELADWSLVTVAEEPAANWRYGLRDVAYWHSDDEQRQLVRRYAGTRLGSLTERSFVARALASDAPVVIPGNATESIHEIMLPGEAHDLISELAPAHGVVVPLRGRTSTVGLLTLFRGEDRPGFSEDDLTLLVDVGVRAGLAMDNARLFREQREVAETLQRSLLSRPMHRDDLAVAVRYAPAADAAQVGGDWYDSFCQADGTTVVVIGDVVGHDMKAAAAMGQLRSLVRGIAVHTDDGPADLLCGVDRAMDSLAVDTTATAIVARVEPRQSGGGSLLRWSNAGHPAPALLARDGGVRLLEDADSDLLLGLDPTVARTEQSLLLDPGDTVVLYTDGLVERRAAGIDTGLAQLTTLLAALGPEAHVEDIAETVLHELMPDRADDDVALLVLRVAG